MFRSLTRFAPRAAAAAMGRPATPAFDIYDVRDDPAQGRHLRCSYNDDARVVNVTVFPQFGPRKEDVNDATPQFDSSRRTTLRLRMNEVADVLAVLKGAQETAAIKSKRFDVKASVVGEEFVLAGSLSRTMGADNAEVVETPYNLALGQSHVIMFARFLEHSLVASFHFKEGPANTSQAQDARGQQRYKQRDQMRRTKEQQQ